MNLFSETENSLNFPTDYNTILDRINTINPIKYAKTRNFINGDVTYLSPYISRGIISSKQVMEIVLAKGYKPYEIEKFLQELAWRDYFQRVLQEKGNSIWDDLKQEQPDVKHNKMIEAVAKANTGIDAIDNKIKELYETGYMHNHLRMYVASITCNMAKAHWRLPATWLYYHLLDGDIASNNCSWQWTAASFSSKKYYFDQANVNKYTGSNQRKSFIDKTYEEIADMEIPQSLKVTIDLDLQTVLPKTDFPIIDYSKPTLIYSSYNLDNQWRKAEDANKILLLEPSHFQKYPVSEKVFQFIIDLSKNIDGIQIFVGEFTELHKIFETNPNAKIIFKEHPLFTHYKGIKDERDWMFPAVTGYYNSFFSFWKKCERYLKK